MRRGQRKLWRELATTAQRVADSTNYAEEYIYGIEWQRAFEALLESERQATPLAVSRDDDSTPA